MAASTNPGDNSPIDGLDESVVGAVVDTTQGLEALGPEWQALAGRSPGHHWFHTYAWCGAVWQHVGAPAGQQLRVITVRQGGRLVLVWPLVIDGWVLRMLNSGTLEYRDLLIEGPGHGDGTPFQRQAWLDAAWHAFTSLRGPSIFVLQNLREPSHLGALLQERMKLEPHTGDWAFVTRLHRYAGWEEFERRLPKALVADQRRQWRRASQLHPGIEVRRVTDPDEIESTVAWMLAHKFRWFDAQGIPATTFRKPAFAHLLQTAAQAAARQGSLCLFKLASPQDVLSVAYGTRFGDEFLLHILAYDSAHGNLSIAVPAAARRRDALVLRQRHSPLRFHAWFCALHLQEDLGRRGHATRSFLCRSVRPAWTLASARADTTPPAQCQRSSAACSACGRITMAAATCTASNERQAGKHRYLKPGPEGSDSATAGSRQRPAKRNGITVNCDVESLRYDLITNPAQWGA